MNPANGASSLSSFTCPRTSIFPEKNGDLHQSLAFVDVLPRDFRALRPRLLRHQQRVPRSLLHRHRGLRHQRLYRSQLRPQAEGPFGNCQNSEVVRPRDVAPVVGSLHRGNYDGLQIITFSIEIYFRFSIHLGSCNKSFPHFLLCLLKTFKPT